MIEEIVVSSNGGITWTIYLGSSVLIFSIISVIIGVLLYLFYKLNEEEIENV